MSKPSIRTTLMDPRLVKSRSAEAQAIAETIVAWSETKPYSSLLNVELMGELVEQEGIPDVVTKESLEALMDGIRMVCGIPRDVVPPVAMDGTMALPIDPAANPQATEDERIATEEESTEKKPAKVRLGDLALGARIKYKRREATLVALPGEADDVEAVIAYLTGEREEQLVSVEELVDVLEASMDVETPADSPRKVLAETEEEIAARNVAEAKKAGMKNAVSLLGLAIDTPIWYDGRPAFHRSALHRPDKSQSRAKIAYADGYRECVEVPLTKAVSKRSKKEALPAPFEPDYPAPPVDQLDCDLCDSIDPSRYGPGQPHIVRFGEVYLTSIDKREVVILFADETGAIAEDSDGRRIFLSLSRAAVEGEKTDAELFAGRQAADGFVAITDLLRGDRFEHLGRVYEFRSNPVGKYVVAREDREDGDKPRDIELSKSVRVKPIREPETVGVIEGDRLVTDDGRVGTVFGADDTGAMMKSDDGELIFLVDARKDETRREPIDMTKPPEKSVTPEPVAVIYEESDPGAQGPVTSPEPLVEMIHVSPHVAESESIELTPLELVAALELMKGELDSKGADLRRCESALEGSEAARELLRGTAQRQEGEIAEKDRKISDLLAKVVELSDRVKELETRKPESVTVGGDMASLLRKLGGKA